MKKYIRVGLILVILAILVSSVTIVFAKEEQNIECTISWPTDAPNLEVTFRSIRGDYYYAGYLEGDIGIENICKGVIPTKGAFFTLEEACLFFYNDASYCTGQDTFYLDNDILNVQVNVHDPDNWAIKYPANSWSMYVDADLNFTLTKTYLFP